MSAKKNEEAILWDLLRLKRPDGSQAIVEMVARIKQLSPVSSHEDAMGNLWIDARSGDEGTMFMAHLDTVHRNAGTTPIYMDTAGIVTTDGKSPLGADDGAGVALLVSMLLAGVPALYLFTQGEECGGHGGRFAARQKDRYKGIERIISFDRRGRFDICGEQCVGTLASVEFVTALAKALGMGHSWAEGTYTDNSEFQGNVREIVNVSVGYMNEHSPAESLNYNYWCELREACIKLDWEALPTVGPDISRDWSAASSYRGFFDTSKNVTPLSETCIVDEEFYKLIDDLHLPETSDKAMLIYAALERVYEACITPSTI